MLACANARSGAATRERSSGSRSPDWTTRESESSFIRRCEVGQPLLHNSAGSQPSVFANTCGSRMTLHESRGLGAPKGTADLAERF